MDSFTFKKIGAPSLLGRISDNSVSGHNILFPRDEISVDNKAKETEGSAASLLARMGLDPQQVLKADPEPKIFHQELSRAAFISPMDLDTADSHNPDDINIKQDQQSVLLKASDASNVYSTNSTTSNLESDGSSPVTKASSGILLDVPNDAGIIDATQTRKPFSETLSDGGCPTMNVSIITRHEDSTRPVIVETALLTKPRVSDKLIDNSLVSSSSVVVEAPVPSSLHELYLDAQRVTALWDQVYLEKKKQDLCPQGGICSAEKSMNSSHLTGETQIADSGLATDAQMDLRQVLLAPAADAIAPPVTTAKTQDVNMDLIPRLLNGSPNSSARKPVNYLESEISRSAQTFDAQDLAISCSVSPQAVSTSETDLRQCPLSVTSPSKVIADEESPKERANRNVEQTFAERHKARLCQERNTAINKNATIVASSSTTQEADEVGHLDDSLIEKNLRSPEGVSVKDNSPCILSSREPLPPQEIIVQRKSDVDHRRNTFVPAETSEGRFNTSATLLPMNRRLTCSTIFQQVEVDGDIQSQTFSISEESTRNLFTDVKNLTPKVEPENDISAIPDQRSEVTASKRKRSTSPTVKIEESNYTSPKMERSPAEVSKPDTISPAKKRRLASLRSGITKVKEEPVDTDASFESTRRSVTNEYAVLPSSVSPHLRCATLDSDKLGFCTHEITSSASIAHSPTYLPTPPLSVNSKRSASANSKSLSDRRSSYSPVSSATNSRTTQVQREQGNRRNVSTAVSAGQHCNDESMKYVRPSNDPPIRSRNSPTVSLQGSRKRSPVLHTNIFRPPVDQQLHTRSPGYNRRYLNKSPELMNTRQHLDVPEQPVHPQQRGLRGRLPAPHPDTDHPYAHPGEPYNYRYPQGVPNSGDERHAEWVEPSTAGNHRSFVANEPLRGDNFGARNRSLSRSVSPHNRLGGPASIKLIRQAQSSTSQSRDLLHMTGREQNIQSDHRFDRKQAQSTSIISAQMPGQINKDILVHQDQRTGRNFTSQSLLERLRPDVVQSPTVHDRFQRRKREDQIVCFPEASTTSTHSQPNTMRKPSLQNRINLNDISDSTLHSTLNMVQSKGISQDRGRMIQSSPKVISKQNYRNNRIPTATKVRLLSSSQKSNTRSLEDRISWE